ncbi:unnamed protein product, partial [Coregonus sp. 'balchen']
MPLPSSIPTLKSSSSIYEQWLRRHMLPRSRYPTANTPIGHSNGYYIGLIGVIVAGIIMTAVALSVRRRSQNRKR